MPLQLFLALLKCHHPTGDPPDGERAVPFVPRQASPLAQYSDLGVWPRGPTESLHPQLPSSRLTTRGRPPGDMPGRATGGRQGGGTAWHRQTTAPGGRWQRQVEMPRATQPKVQLRSSSARIAPLLPGSRARGPGPARPRPHSPGPGQRPTLPSLPAAQGSKRDGGAPTRGPGAPSSDTISRGLPSSCPSSPSPSCAQCRSPEFRSHFPTRAQLGRKSWESPISPRSQETR